MSFTNATKKVRAAVSGINIQPLANIEFGSFRPSTAAKLAYGKALNNKKKAFRSSSYYLMPA